jgi:hypothetical protein
MALNRKFFSNLLLGLFFSPFTIVENEMAIAQQTSRHHYPTTFVSDYMKDCQKSVIARDIPAEEAVTLCTCTLDRFRSQYSLTEFQALVKDAKKDKKAANKLTKVGNTCFEQILYEQ